MRARMQIGPIVPTNRGEAVAQHQARIDCPHDALTAIQTGLTVSMACKRCGLQGRACKSIKEAAASFWAADRWLKWSR